MRSAVAKRHTLERPWTEKYWNDHSVKKMGNYGKAVPVVEPIREKDWMWFRGDRVEILTGPDKGKQGYINMIVQVLKTTWMMSKLHLCLFQERNWVTVEGLNVTYETHGATKDYPGMTMKQELPLIVTTDIKLVDPSNEKGSEVEWRFSEAGERIRVAVKTGTDIPMPTKAQETMDYKTPQDYKANEFKDTVPKVVEEITYEPSLATFEMDCMQAMGIKETRIPRKSWWY
jgi:large subunit ribosomal protein L24